MQEHARQAMKGDREALNIIIMLAPAGMRGMKPEDYAAKLAEDSAFAEEEGKQAPFGDDEDEEEDWDLEEDGEEK
jgi:hypothetical protein